MFFSDIANFTTIAPWNIILKMNLKGQPFGDWLATFGIGRCLCDTTTFPEFEVESIQPVSCVKLLNRYFNAMSKAGNTSNMADVGLVKSVARR